MYEQSESIAKLALALSKAQGGIRAASKDSTNPHFKSRYADLASIWDVARLPLSSNELSVVQMPLTDNETMEVRLSTMLIHSSGEWIRSTVGARPDNLKPQSVGSALTYLRRYAFAAMIGVVADDDDDGNAAQSQQSRPQATRPQAVPPAPKAEPSGLDQWKCGSRALAMEIINGCTALKEKLGYSQDQIVATLTSMDFKGKDGKLYSYETISRKDLSLDEATQYRDKLHALLSANKGAN